MIDTKTDETRTGEALELESVIREAVDRSVRRAFRKYGRGGGNSRLLRIIIALVVVAALGVGVYLIISKGAAVEVAPIEEHDLILENDGIFGFTVADFQEPVLGEGVKQRILIVEEQEIFINTTLTEAGLFNWGVFNKLQPITVHGTGQFTIDLTDIEESDISLNEDTYELTIKIPHAELHQVYFDPEKTEVGDVQTGWLTFGDIKTSPEQQKTFEVAVIEQLNEKLNDSERFEEADRFAKLAAYETYQPIVSAVSPAYKVVIEFQEA